MYACYACLNFNCHVTDNFFCEQLWWQRDGETHNISNVVEEKMTTTRRRSYTNSQHVVAQRRENWRLGLRQLLLWHVAAVRSVTATGFQHKCANERIGSIEDLSGIKPKWTVADTVCLDFLLLRSWQRYIGLRARIFTTREYENDLLFCLFYLKAYIQIHVQLQFI